MSKHIGTIIDKSYYYCFLRHTDKNTYEKRMCLYCDEEIEVGVYRNEENAPYSIAPFHKCKDWIDEARRRNGYLNTLLENQGFVFIPCLLPKPSKAFSFTIST